MKEKVALAVKLATAILLVVLGVTVTKAEMPTFLVLITWGFAFWYAVEVFFILAKGLGLSKLAGEYTTYDIMVMAILIAAGGVLKAYWAQVRMIVESFAGPFGGFIIGPGFYFWAILACYLVRKPLSGTISMVLGGIIEILAGNPFGLPVLAFNFWEGLGPDLAYGAFRFKKYNLLVAIIGGLLASYFGVFYGWYYFGFEYLGLNAFLLYLLTKAIGGILAGVIGHYIAVGLERIGIRPPERAIVEG